MDYSQRQELRKQKLKELYDHYHESGGKWKNIIPEIREDKEVYLAYKYLDDKGLIDFKEQRGAGDTIMFADVRINSSGIDVIEAEEDIR